MPPVADKRQPHATMRNRQQIATGIPARAREEWFALRALLARRRKRACPDGMEAPAAVLIFTPERSGEEMLALLNRLPREVAVLYRCYDEDGAAGGMLLRLARLCAAQRRLLWVAGGRRQASGLPLRVKGRHLPAWMMRLPGQAARRRQRLRPMSAAVHDMGEGRLARRLHVPVLLVSPVFATASHPHARPLDVYRFARLARHLRRADRSRRILALGGMTAGRMRRLRGLADGFAAIGYWSRLAAAGHAPDRKPDRPLPS